MTAGPARGRRAPLLSITESDELASMSRTMRSAIQAKSPHARVAEIADGPEEFDRELWQVLAAELGVTGVLVPEEYGGLGLSWREMRVVLDEQGRALACVPFLSSCVIAVSILLASDDKAACAEVLPGIADGSCLVSVALGEESLLADEPRSTVAATPTEGMPAEGAPAEPGSWTLRGQARFVADGMVADRVLIPAVLADRRHGWFLADTAAAGLGRTAMSVVDTTRPQATLTLDAVPARLVGQPAAADRMLGPALDAAVLGLACEQSAASRFLLEATVAYAATRFQFGQPIGSFQAVQHHLADLALLVDTSVSAVEYAVWAATHEPQTLTEAASMAAVVCSETMRTVASEAIQLHGGTGFTWEHFAHRYFRRALTSWSWFGKPSYHRERLLQSLSI